MPAEGRGAVGVRSIRSRRGHRHVDADREMAPEERRHPSELGAREEARAERRKRLRERGAAANANEDVTKIARSCRRRGHEQGQRRDPDQGHPAPLARMRSAPAEVTLQPSELVSVTSTCVPTAKLVAPKLAVACVAEST